MEEWVGEKWHNFIIRKSTLSYPQSQVKLSGFKSQLGVFLEPLVEINLTKLNLQWH